MTVNKRSFRFVTTHLEPFDPFVRANQAAELVAPGGPAAASEDPVVLVGDINIDPNDPAPHGTAFDVLAAAGLEDTWVLANGSGPGFTRGFGELLDDPDTGASTPDRPRADTRHRSARVEREIDRPRRGQPHAVRSLALRPRWPSHDAFP